MRLVAQKSKLYIHFAPMSTKGFVLPLTHADYIYYFVGKSVASHKSFALYSRFRFLEVIYYV